MGRFGRVVQKKRSVVVVATGLVVVVLGAMAGAAWAKGPARPGVDLATTYRIELAPVPGQPDSSQRVEWTVGQATIATTCWAGYNDPANPDRISMSWGGGATNNGPGPIGVVAPHGDSETIVWLDEGESIDVGPGPGQSINETNFPGPVGGIQTLGILDEDGISASGLYAFSARVDTHGTEDASDDTARCVLSLQMRG